ncbi:MAG: hypothetical protein QME66_04660 [Candidatus Eisenbacteria bacterium]|nr:hypothetical protein [Candidatus Eisenbacteria bacterium]
MGKLVKLVIQNARFLPRVITYLPKILLFKNVAREFEVKTGEPRPVIATRRWNAIILGAISFVVLVRTGMTLSPEMLDQIQAHVQSIIAAVTGLWAIALFIYGVFKKNK